MKKSFLVALCVTTCAAGYAIPFDTVTVGGTATVGVGGDYASLEAAASAFNAIGAPYLQGDWKLEILSDLTENVNVSFGNTLPEGSSLTMKPAAETSSTITFTPTVDNGGVSGHLVIGDNDLADWTLVATQNFIIDGSNNGTNSRNLTITNTSANTHTFSSPLAVVGECDGVTLKNLTLPNASTGTGSAISGIQIVSRANDGVVYSPQNITIENCNIYVPQTQGHGLNFRVSGTLPSTVESIAGMKIINNTIQARLRGIFMDSGMDAEITSNTISAGAVGSVVTGFMQPTIFVNNARSSTNQTLTISGNSLFVRSQNVSAGDFGPVAVTVGGAGSAASGNVVNFVNNMVSFQFTNSTSSASASNYIAFRAASAITYNVLHNSINMPSFANLTGLTPARATAIKLPETVAYTANIHNNIIRVDQAGASAINITSSSATAPTVVSDRNILYAGTSSFIGATGLPTAIVTHQTLGAWQTATSQDANSASVDPTATTGSSWQAAIGSTDLHFYPSNVKPVGIPLQPRLASVPVDFDGTPRDEQTVPGADEVLEFPASVSDWSVY